MRIIDIQQVLMQEPLVAWQAAALITHPEIQNEIIRQKQMESKIRKASRVAKSQRVIIPDGISTSDKIVSRLSGKSNKNFSQINLIL